jgi:hypothetical protein
MRKAYIQVWNCLLHNNTIYTPEQIMNVTYKQILSITKLKEKEYYDKPIYVFLDIDDVLNSISGAIARFDMSGKKKDGTKDLYEENINALEYFLILFPYTKIIIISEQRRFVSDPKELFINYPKIAKHIIGKTEFLPHEENSCRRSKEILKYYNENLITTKDSILIIDNEDSFADNISSTINNFNSYIVDGTIGLTHYDVYSIYNKLVNKKI